jgi:hypothetical protein
MLQLEKATMLPIQIVLTSYYRESITFGIVEYLAYGRQITAWIPSQETDPVARRRILSLVE